MSIEICVPFDLIGNWLIIYIPIYIKHILWYITYIYIYIHIIYHMFINIYIYVHITFVNANTSEESHPIAIAYLRIEAGKTRTCYICSNTMITIDKFITPAWMFITFYPFLFLTEVIWNFIFTKWIFLISIAVYFFRERLLCN